MSTECLSATSKVIGSKALTSAVSIWIASLRLPSLNSRIGNASNGWSRRKEDEVTVVAAVLRKVVTAVVAVDMALERSPDGNGGISKTWVLELRIEPVDMGDFAEGWSGRRMASAARPVFEQRRIKTCPHVGVGVREEGIGNVRDKDNLFK